MFKGLSSSVPGLGRTPKSRGNTYPGKSTQPKPTQPNNGNTSALKSGQVDPLDAKYGAQHVRFSGQA